MLIDKANCVTVSDPKDRGTRTPHGAYFTPKGTMSTNGKMMLLVPYPSLQNSKDFPEIKGGAAATSVVETTEFVKGAMLDKIAKAIPTTAPYHTILQHAAVEIGPEKPLIATVSDGETSQTFRASACEKGTYPDFGKIIPRWEDRSIRVTVDIEILRDLLDSMIKVARARDSKGRTLVIGLCQKPEDRQCSSMLLSLVNTELRGVTGVMMPIRGGDFTPSDEPWKEPCENATETPETETPKDSEAPEPEADSFKMA